MHARDLDLDLAATLAFASEVARAAGALLLAETRRPDGPRGRPGHCPVDAEAERMLRDRIRAAFPTHGLRGEELADEDRAPEPGVPWLWLVDPNDGTSAMQKGYRGAAVSIGLVHGDRPVLGVVLAYDWPDDDGTLFTWAEGQGPVRVNGEVAPPLPGGRPLETTDTILVSHQADRRSLENALACAPARFLPVPGIALRLARVAAGHGVAALSLHGPRDFDYAAGHALVVGAGGDLYDHRGRPMRYHAERGNAGVVACFGGASEMCLRLVERDWNPVLAAAARAPTPFDLAWPEPGRRTADAGVLSRARGALLGQCIGDALGSLVEFETPADIAERYPDGGPHTLADGGLWNTLAGQCTDDTELALALARAVRAVGHFDAEVVAEAYVSWLESEPFDAGATVTQACRAGRGAPPGSRAEAMRAAASPTSQANGALMRLSTLAVHLAFASDAVRDAAVRADTELTHPHPACVGASLVFAHALAFAVRAGAPAALVHAEALRRAEADDVPPEVRAWARASMHPLDLDFTDKMGWVRLAFTQALAALRENAPPMEVLRRIVRQGGDTDTNAAIAGALLGAVHGAGAWPPDAVDRVLTCRPLQGLPGVHRPRPRTYWPVDLHVLAEQLLDRGRALGTNPIETGGRKRATTVP